MRSKGFTGNSKAFTAITLTKGMRSPKRKQITHKNQGSQSPANEREIATKEIMLAYTAKPSTEGFDPKLKMSSKFGPSQRSEQQQKSRDAVCSPADNSRMTSA